VPRLRGLHPKAPHLLAALGLLGATLVVALVVSHVLNPSPRCGRLASHAAVEEVIPRPPAPVPGDAALAYRFEPTLVVAQADRNWPASITTVLHLEVGGRITCLHSAAGCRDPEDPDTLLHGGGRVRCPQPGGACYPPLEPADIPPRGASDDDWLVYPTPLAGTPTQLAELAAAVGGDCTSTAATRVLSPHLPFDPRPVAREYFLSSPRMPPRFRLGHLRLDTSPLNPPPRLPLRSLQYWFFYPFNYLPLSVLRTPRLVTLAPNIFPKVDYHQGDFEHVDVIVDRADRLVGVYMARHKADESVTLRPNDGGGPLGHDEVLVEKDRSDAQARHPVVFASLGGHGSYADCVPFRRHVVPLYDYPVCPADPTALRVRFDPSFDSAVAPAYVFRDVGLVPLADKPWACWGGRFGAVPRVPGLAQLAFPSAHLERPPRLGAWAKLNKLVPVVPTADVYPLQPGPATPRTQDGGTCGRVPGPTGEETSPLG
jgi:hypothetical protein